MNPNRASLFDDAMASRARADAARAARERAALLAARATRGRALEDAREDREQWDALEAKLERLREDGDGGGFDALVDVGGEIRARARARDARAVFVDVGLGFMAEMTVEEGLGRARDARRDAAAREDDASRALRDVETSLAEIERRVGGPLESEFAARAV